jgi:hypothetical protein
VPPAAGGDRAEAAERRSLLELVGQSLEETRGGSGGLGGQPPDQPVDHGVGELFHLGVDGSHRLVGERTGRAVEVAHALG